GSGDRAQECGWRGRDCYDGGAGTSGAPMSSDRKPGESLSDYVNRKQAEGKMMVPTAQTRARGETASKVIALIGMIRQTMQGMSLGPIASRVRNMRTTAGFPDPRFMKYSDQVGLLQTALMNMHVGARGGERLLAKFQKMLDAGVQSPENMGAA